MKIKIACDALLSGKRLKVTYSGHQRIVEVHAVGRTKAQKEVMRLWQVSGGSVSGENVGWKLFRLDGARDLTHTAEVSNAPRNGYQRNDKAMATIICQL